MKFLVMHITNQKLSFYIFTVGSLLNVLMIFALKKIYNFDPCSVFLTIATNIPQWLKIGFVVQGHIYEFSS